MRQMCKKESNAMKNNTGTPMVTFVSHRQKFILLKVR